MKLSIEYVHTISLTIALVTGLCKLKKIESANKYFIYFIILSFSYDILGLIFDILFKNNLILANFYFLFSFYLLNKQFKIWKLYNSQPKLFIVLNTIVLIVWFFEFYKNKNFFALNNYSWAISSFFLVILGIQQINRILFKDKGSLLLNNRFLMSLGIIIINTLYTLMAIFLNFNFEASNSFYLSVFKLHTPISILINLLFAFSILRIPIRKKFLTIDN